jgi:uncharacterized integral membrane protein
MHSKLVGDNDVTSEPADGSAVTSNPPGGNPPPLGGNGDSIPWIATISFFLAILLSIVFISIAVFTPRSVLVNEATNDYPLIPLYVVVFSVIGGLMYFFASTSGAWVNIKEVKEESKEEDKIRIDSFNKKNFFVKLSDLDIERKGLRVLAAPLIAIGIYLLFDTIFSDYIIATEQLDQNISLANSSIKDIITAIESTNNNEKIVFLKAGISFLAGAFVKQFLDLIQAVADRIGK